MGWGYSVGKGLDFGNVRLAVGKAVLRDVAFLNSADDEQMAPQVEHMHNFALQVYRTLLNEGATIQCTLEQRKLADIYFIYLGAGYDAAIVGLSDHIAGRYINGESEVLPDAF